MNKTLKIFINSLFIGFFLFFYLLAGEIGSFKLTGKSFDYLMFFLLLTFIIVYLLYLINQKIDNKTQLKNNFALWFLIIYPLNLLILAIILYLAGRIFNLLHFNNISFDILYVRNKELALKIIFISIISLLIYLISDYFMSAYNKLMNLRLRGEQIAADKLRLNFEVLENQLKPHYLFNNLNTISALIYTNKEKAENFIYQLANTYDYVLKCTQKRLVPVSEELKFIDAYTFLMKTRYENALNIKLNIDNEAKKGFIVPLSLQLLVENALKHNVMDKENPLNINIYNEKNYLIVENSLNTTNNQSLKANKLKDEPRTKSHKIGLKNISERYKLISNKEVKISKAKTFRVAIPILKNNE